LVKREKKIDKKNKKDLDEAESKENQKKLVNRKKIKISTKVKH
jgi:gamma-glutamyl phosphate reductase